MIYLDNAATSMLKPHSVAKAVADAINNMASPGRGGHIPAMRAAETVYNCRAEAAELFNVNSAEQIVFTVNATHGLNIAISSMVKRGDKVVISGFEHNSVTRPLAAAGANIVVAGRCLFDNATLLDDFAKKIKGSKLVVCTHVSNVFGYILPVNEISKLCREESVPLIIDASQSAGLLPINFDSLCADFVAMPGHKGLLGPQGTGILICREVPAPLMHGGSGSDSISQKMPEYLPDRLEAGTLNTAGIAGLLEGIRYVRKRGIENIIDHERKLMKLMVSQLSASNYKLFVGRETMQSGVLSLLPENRDCEALAQRLAAKGICVRSGLHCAPTAHISAGTIESGTVRFSFSPFISPAQIMEVCRVLKHLDIKN